MFITNSEITAHNTCQLKHNYKYIKTISPKTKSAALETGTEYHDLLENYYTTNNPTLLHRQPDDERLSSYMAENYIDWLEETQADKHWEIIGIEQQIQATINGHTFKGKYDLKILDTRTGKKYFVDHKTCGNYGIENYAEHLQQFRLYHLIDSYQNSGDPVSGTWLNMAKKVKGTGRYTPPIFKRTLIPTNPAIIVNDEIMFTKIADQIQKSYNNPKPERTLSTACNWCEYKQPCLLQSKGHEIEDVLFIAFDKQDPNERYKNE